VATGINLGTVPAGDRQNAPFRSSIHFQRGLALVKIHQKSPSTHSMEWIYYFLT